LKIQGAIFDLDGTLLDSMSIWDSLGENYLKSIGKVPKHGLKEKLSAMSLTQAAEFFISEYGVNISMQEILKGFNEMISGFYTEHASIKMGVLEFLKKLKQKNIKACIATANDRVLVEIFLEKYKLFDYFQYILTCDEVGSGKDNAAIFNEALKALGTEKKETYVFEDALFAVKTAKKEGFPVVAVFDESAVKEQEEIKSTADMYIQSFLEMEDYFD